MDKNNVIGLVLIFILLYMWTTFNAPSEEQLAIQQLEQDSIARAHQDSIAKLELNKAIPEITETETAASQPALSDSLRNIQANSEFSVFAPSAFGTEKTEILENDVFKITFSSKGGRPVEVELFNYKKILLDSLKDEYKVPLKLLEDSKNKFEFELPVSGAAGGIVKTGDLYFTSRKQGNSIVFTASAGEGRYFEQTYSLAPGSYNIDYDVKLFGLDNYVRSDNDALKLKWVNFLDRIERSTKYEQNYTSIYFKKVDDDTDNCSCTGADEEDADGDRLKWISHSNQFFNSTLISEKSFKSAKMEIELTDENSDDLKKLVSEIMVPIGGEYGNTASMDFYVGPNEYKTLAAYNLEMENIIPYGTSIFGTVNRYIIRPIFNFLSQFIGSKGIVILVLTLIVKLLLYPLTYKMLRSQSKMAALKPQMAKMKEKYGEDKQKQQMESMKVYREFGVNPLGGCFPIALQMPIWFALYRFFPASIEFRQASFLWATDLSSFDVFFKLPFELPLGMGAHISMFTVLWAVTTVIYTYYNSKHMDMSAQPMMKYMQYLMPVMFLGFFNSYASGLTCYLFFSNLFNITQTIVTKNYIIDQEKIKRELNAYSKKPKKKSGFGARLESAMKQAQQVQAEKRQLRKRRSKLMRYILLGIFLCSILSCGNRKLREIPIVTIETPRDTSKQIEINTEEPDGEVAPRLILEFQKTACFGKCPTFKIRAFSDGRVLYHGQTNVSKIGFHEAFLKAEDLNGLFQKAEHIGFFQFQDTYPHGENRIPDLPKTIVFLKTSDFEKRVNDAYGSPKELQEFENFLSDYFSGLEWLKIEGDKRN